MDKSFDTIEKNNGKTIRELRLHRKLTQRELGEGIMLQSSVGKIENGESQPLFLNLVKIVDRLNIDVNEFLFIANNYEANDKTKLVDFIERYEYKGDFNLAEQAIQFSMQKFAETDDAFYYYMQISIECWLYMMKEGSFDLPPQLLNRLQEVWDYLVTISVWYLSDIFMLSMVLLLLPFDAALFMGESALSHAYKYESLHIGGLAIQRLLSTLAVLTVIGGDYQRVLLYTNKLIDESKQDIPLYRLSYTLINRAIALDKLGDTGGAKTNLSKAIMMLVASDNTDYLMTRRRFIKHFDIIDLTIFDQIYAEISQFL